MSLKEYRDCIDTIDTQLIDLFEKRLSVVQEISTWKRNHQVPIEDSQRETEIIEKAQKQISNKDLAPYVIDFFKSIFAITKKQQKELNK